MTEVRTVKRPEARYIRGWRPEMVGDDTVEDFLRGGMSLVIYCRACQRDGVEWAPPELEAKFGDRPGLRLADLLPRLKCSGADGCGSQDIAVGPQDYEGVWTWNMQPT